MSKLEQQMIKTIRDGLSRKTVNTASKWSERYRVIPTRDGVDKPWSFLYHPWLRGMHDCESEEIVGQKAAQMGYTELALNKTFYAIDILRQSVIYVLPATTPDASDFSKSRFDPALEASEHLRRLFVDVSNIGHKRAGSCNLYIRGSRSRSQMKSVPAARLFFDELDEMVQDNVTLALERASGQTRRQIFYLSTPTAPGYGINAYFERSTQQHFFFKCPSCGRHTELIYPDCLVITADDPNDRRILESHLICKECKGLLPHDSKHIWLANGSWERTQPDCLAEGFYINQLYSTALEPYKIAQLALLAESKASAEQELWNSKLGMPRVVADSRLTDEDLNNCIKSFTSGVGRPSGLVTMGVDIGPKTIHWVIMHWVPQEHNIVDATHRVVGRMIAYGTCPEFDEIEAKLRLYTPNQCIIDANPERRQSLSICKQFPGAVNICIYEGSLRSHELKESNTVEHCLLAARTNWIDRLFERIRIGNMWFPLDTSLEFRKHLKAPMKIHREDTAGNQVGFYVNKVPDHYAHACVYAEIAMDWIIQKGQHRTIT